MRSRCKRRIVIWLCMVKGLSAPGFIVDYSALAKFGLCSIALHYIEVPGADPRLSTSCLTSPAVHKTYCLPPTSSLPGPPCSLTQAL